MYIWSQVSSDIKKYLKKDEGIMPLEFACLCLWLRCDTHIKFTNGLSM